MESLSTILSAITGLIGKKHFKSFLLLSTIVILLLLSTPNSISGNVTPSPLENYAFALIKDEIVSLKKEKANLEVKVKNIEFDFEHEQKSNSLLIQDISRLKTELARTNLKLEKELSKMNYFLKYGADPEMRLILENEIKILERDNRNLMNELDSASSENTKLRNDICILKKEVENLQYGAKNLDMAWKYWEAYNNMGITTRKKVKLEALRNAKQYAEAAKVLNAPGGSKIYSRINSEIARIN
ncbi:MAG: hypothetical protein CMB80_03890 [Flammeovirgaceae bacterium]|nr:hypothetical protein [Flammeovirgaceae bacterium]|tara:strand:+ start:34559 stop:35287 length:729 start_codon:yes stop_codon:yes gene_type:complete